MKKIIIFITTIISLNSIAQTVDFNEHLYDNINLDYLSTNIFADKAGAPDMLFGYNGSSSCESSSLGNFLYAYNIFYSGHVRSNNPFPPTQSITNNISTERKATIPIEIAYFKYNFLDENAIEHGYIGFNNNTNQFFSIHGNPFFEKTCLVFSPLFYDSFFTTAKFKAAPIKGNLLNNIASTQINFGDGNGYVNYIVNNTYTINYPTEGEFILTLKITLTNGNIVYAKSKINTVYEIMHTQAGSITHNFNSDYPCDANNNIVPNYNSVYRIYQNGDRDDALIKVWYGNDQYGNQKQSLTKPIVIVDGFDPIPLKAADRSAEEIYFETNFSDKYIKDYDCDDINDETRMRNINKGLIDRLKDLGYDIAIVDFEWGGNDINVNVEGLKGAINKLNTILANNNSEEELVVMGPSMGALISRIALSEMTNHNTRMYISFDGPQQGAYIPMPLQEFYEYAFNIGLNQPNLLAAILAISSKFSPLDCPAAKQMLMYHHTATVNGGPFQPDASHTNLYNAYKGKYPGNGCINVAISCGNGHGAKQSYFPLKGNDYLGYEVTNTFVKTKIEFKELPDNGTPTEFFKFRAWSKMGPIKINYINIARSAYATSTTKSFEQEPGGNFNSNYMISGLLQKLHAPFTYDKLECFMPLSTALDLSSGVSNNIFAQFAIREGRNFTKNEYKNKSPFDFIFVEGENRYHVLRGPQMDDANHSSKPGLTKELSDFVVFAVENKDNFDGLDKNEVYDLYDIYYNVGIQTCDIGFNQNFIADGTVKRSYNNTNINISGISITGSEIDTQIYTTQSITIGANTLIDKVSSFYANIGDCL